VFFVAAVPQLLFVHAALPHKNTTLRLCRKTKTEKMHLDTTLIFSHDVSNITSVERVESERNEVIQYIFDRFQFLPSVHFLHVGHSLFDDIL
jgi:hypothetical protein